MKTCPYCGRENPDTAVTCVECSSAFDAALTPKAPTDPALSDPALNPVIVARFSNLQEASVLAGRLNDAGIEAWIPEEYSEQVFSGVVGLERLTVRVAAKNYSDAMALVADSAEASVASPAATPLPSTAQTTPKKTATTVTNGPTKLCVSCGKQIPIDAALCPICDYAQPLTAPTNP